MDHLRFKKRGRPLAVSRHLLCQRRIDIVKRLPELIVILILTGDLRIARQTVSQYYKRIVGGSISVHRDHIKSIFHIFPQRLLQKLFGDSRIRGHKGKHGAHIRMNHTGTLAHAAHRHGPAAQLNLHRRLLGYRIRSHDGFRRLRTRFFRSSSGCRQLLHS